MFSSSEDESCGGEGGLESIINVLKVGDNRLALKKVCTPALKARNDSAWEEILLNVDLTKEKRTGNRTMEDLLPHGKRTH